MIEETLYEQDQVGDDDLPILKKKSSKQSPATNGELPILKKKESGGFDSFPPMLPLQSTVEPKAPDTQSPPENILKLFKERKQIREHQFDNRGYGVGGAPLSQDLIDEQKKKLTDVNEKIKASGYDEGIATDLEDLPEGQGFSFREDIPALKKQREENAATYTRNISAIKSKGNLFNAINANSGLKAAGEEIRGLQELEKVDARAATRKAIELARTNIENKNERDNVIKHIINDKSYDYGIQPIDQETQEKFQHLNPYQQRAMRFLQDVDPATFDAYSRVLSTNPDEQWLGSTEKDVRRGYELKSRELETIGMGLMSKALEERLTDLQKKGENATPQERDEFQKLYGEYQTLATDKTGQKERYPTINQLDAERLMQESMGANNSPVKKFFLGVGENFDDAINWVGDLVQDKGVTGDLELMGDKEFTQSAQRYTPESDKLIGSDFTAKFDSGLQSKIDEIKNNSSLSDDQKREQVSKVIQQNSDKISYAPNDKAGKGNFTAKAIFNTVGDVASDLVSQLAIASLSGGAGNASKLKELSSLFGSTYATAYNDYYNDALRQNIAKPSEYAIMHTTIEAASELINNDFEMAKKIVGGKGTLGKVLNSVTKSQWDDIAKKGFFQKFKQAAGETVKTGFKNAFQETTEEVAGQLAGNIGDAQVFNKETGLGDGIKETTISTMVGMLPLGLISLPFNYKNINRTQKYAMYEAGMNPQKFLESIDADLRNGAITPQEAEKRKENIELAAKAVAASNGIRPDGKPMTDNEKTDFAFNQMVLQQIKEQKKNAPTAVKEKLEKEEEKLDKENNELLTKKRVRVVVGKGEVKNEDLENKEMLSKAEAAADAEMNPIYARSFKSDVEGSLREAAQQLNATESEAKTAREMYGNTISDIALKMFPNEKPPIMAAEMESQINPNETKTTEVPKQTEVTGADQATVDKAIEPAKEVKPKIEKEEDFAAELDMALSEPMAKIGEEKTSNESAINEADYKDAGKIISKSKEVFAGDPLIERVTSFLEPIAAKQNLSFENTSLPDRTYGYSHGGGKIQLDLAQMGNDKTALPVALHEMMHEATRNEINTNEAFKGELDGVLGDIREALGVKAPEQLIPHLVSAGIIEGDKYGTANAHELVAEVFTNPKFNEYLSGIEYKGKNLLERVIEAIVAFFNKQYGQVSDAKSKIDAKDMAEFVMQLTEQVVSGKQSQSGEALGALKGIPDPNDLIKRGADMAIQKINTAVKSGILSQRSADLGIALLKTNPKVFEDLAILILPRKGSKMWGEGDGFYRQKDAQARVFRKSGVDTLVHELLHHTERFLPQESREAIIKEWKHNVNEKKASLERKVESGKASDKEVAALSYLNLALDRQKSTQEKGKIAAKMGEIYESGLGRDYDYYKFTTPSEWWAVNASRIFRENHESPKTWVQKAIDYIEKVLTPLMNFMYGKDEFADVAKGLKMVTEGKTLDTGVENVLANESELYNIKNDEQKERIKDLIKRAESIPTEKLAEIISKKAQIPIKEATALINSVRKPKVRVVAGAPPKKPPTQKEAKEESFKNEPKSILNAIHGSENISESVKAKFEKKGLTYSPQSHEESRAIAKEIIDRFGVDNSISMAESGRFDGDVNSMIFTEGIDRTFIEEQEATNIEDKTKLAEQWADYSLRYDEAARQKGKFISAIYDFYKKSPLGVILAERARRQEAFQEWFDKREKPYKEVFDTLKNEPEFKELLKEAGASKSDTADYRKKRREKISNFFNKAKIGNKGTNFAIVPPQIWDGAVEVMKQAFLAGESVAAVIEKGIKHINSNHKEAWDEERFADEWTTSLNQLDAEQKELKKESQQRLLDKFRKKLAGLTDSQKYEVISKSFKKLVDNGALEYDDFKKIVANSLGLGELSAEHTAKIQGLIYDINAVQDASDNVMKQKEDADIREAIKKFDAVAKKAAKSATELAGSLYHKTDIGQRIRSIIQLNTLGPVSLIKNPFYNIFHQALVRFPKGLLMTGIDQAIYGASLLGSKIFGNPVIKPDVNILLAQKGYFTKGAEGGAESIKQVFTGLTNKDYFQKEVYNSQIKPFQSWRDLIAHAKGEKQLSRAQWWDKAIQAFPLTGISAEIVARGLNIGDKGFRFAAEGAIADTIAKQEFNLSGAEKERFIRFPKETAKKIYKSKGLSDEQASEKAEAIEKRIVTEGEESVFQQDNIVSKLIARVKQGLSSIEDESSNPLVNVASKGAKLLGVLNMPFMKTPINIGWEVINLVNPELALAQAIVYGGKAIKTKSRADILQAKKWMAHAAVGWALMSSIGYLASIGAVSGDDEDEPYKEKEAKGKGTFEKPRRVNMNKVWRAMNGESAETKDGDMMVDLSWFGASGMIMNMQANKYENMTKEERESMSYVDGLLNRLHSGATEGLTNSVFQGSLTAVDAIRTGKADQWLNGMMNVGMNFIEPAAIAQVSRATRPYEYSIKGDDLSETLKNSIKSRLFGSVPPRVNIWGEQMEKGSPMLTMLGISRADKDSFGFPVFEDFKRTGNSDFFPPATKGEVKGHKLGAAETVELQILVGQARKALVAPFVNDAAVMKVKEDDELVDKKYSELSDTQKIKRLKDLYETGAELGRNQFINLHPEYRKKKKD